MCDGKKHCIEGDVCPGACHHCLHFPRHSCSNPEDMVNLNWSLLGEKKLVTILEKILKYMES